MRSRTASSRLSAMRSIPGPDTRARLAFALSRASWPALTELIASCCRWPPNAQTDIARLPTTTSSAISAMAARRWVSRRLANGVTRR